MILGSDSHTRYGALGTMAVGEGGGELAKQLCGRTYDVKMPPVVAKMCIRDRICGLKYTFCDRFHLVYSAEPSKAV